MENPVQYAMRKAGIGTNGLARRLFVSKQYISRVEKGCAVNLNPYMLKWIKETIEDDFELLTDEGIQNWFNVWKTCKRISILQARSIPLPNLYKTPDRIEVISLQERGPLEGFNPQVKFIPNTFDKVAYLKWRQDYWDNTYKFSTDMCVTPASVDIYEKSTRNRPSPELVELFSWIIQYGPESPVANKSETSNEVQ